MVTFRLTTKGDPVKTGTTQRNSAWTIEQVQKHQKEMRTRVSYPIALEDLLRKLMGRKSADKS